MNSENENKDEIKNEEAEMERGFGRGCGPGFGRGRGRCGGRKRLWFIPLIILGVLAKGAVIMVLWNALIPDLFHGPLLDYPQALGLMILVKVLVGFGGSWGFHRFGHRFGHHGHHHGMRKHFWSKMSDEERQKFREHFRRKWDE